MYTSFKTLIFVMIIGTGTFAHAKSKDCHLNAKKYVQAFSQISFSILDEGQAKIVSSRLIRTSNVSNGTQEIYEVESLGSKTEPLKCIYQIKMLKNITDDCWAESLRETECSG